MNKIHPVVARLYRRVLIEKLPVKITGVAPNVYRVGYCADEKIERKYSLSRRFYYNKKIPEKWINIGFLGPHTRTTK